MGVQSQRARGYALVEILFTLVVIALVAAVAAPRFSTADSKKVDAAAEEVANAMRFALAEANRTGGYILIDGSTSGHLKIYTANSSGNTQGAVTDPLTKRALDLNINGSAFSSGVTVTPKFMAGGSARNQLLIGPVNQPNRFNAYSDGGFEGVLQSGSGVVLTLGSQSSTVLFNEVTGLVTLP